MSTSVVQNNANSGWLYHIGDVIFGNVLLISSDGLYETFSIYASDITSISAFNHPSELGLYDCIILSDIDHRKYISDLEIFQLLKKNGVIARVSVNETGIKSILSPKYPITLLRYFYTRIFNNSDVLSKTYSMLSDCNQIEEVFYSSGYTPIKNVFLFKEKLKKIIFNKWFYSFFSPLKMKVSGSGAYLNASVIDNIVEVFGEKFNFNNLVIEKCRIIPYKVLVTVRQDAENSFIILLLRGSGGNIRANSELNMLAYLNENHPALSSLLSVSIASGTYKKVEYIIYKELHGVHIDCYFNMFDKAEDAAFNMLLYVGRESKKVGHLSKGDFLNLVYPWIERLVYCDVNTGKLSKYLETLFNDLWEVLSKNKISFVLFHGDFKIENLLFNSSNYEVLGIIDWDLSVKSHFPSMDLLYFIFYNRKIKNHSSFVEECERVFLQDGFTENENSMINEYCEQFNVTDKMLTAFLKLFLLHHFSCREQCSFSEEWLIALLNEISDD